MLDFLCIGAQKAGTTWLMANLARHPKVWTPRFAKEIHYFDKIHLGYKRDSLKSYTKRCSERVAQDAKFSAYFSRVIDPEFAYTDPWYRFIFTAAPRKKKRGECTPLYCALPPEGIQHVHQLAPTAAIIFLIRDPFDRAMSSLRMEMNFRNIKHSEDAHFLLQEPLFSSRGRYSVNIPNWENVYPRNKILYIPFGDIKSQPNEVMKSVENHIGLPSFEEYPRLHDRINKTSPENIEITEKTISKVSKIVEGESQFLHDYFGQDFYQRTK